MEFIKKLIFRGKISGIKEDIKDLAEKLEEAKDEKKNENYTAREKEMLAQVKEGLEELTKIAPSELVRFIVEDLPDSESRKNISSLAAKILEELEKDGEKLLMKAFLNPKYQNNSALAPLVPTLLKFRRHSTRSFLGEVFSFHSSSTPIRSSVIENLAQISNRKELEYIFTLLRESKPSEALQLFFALRKDVVPDKLRAYEKHINVLVNQPDTSLLGYYLLGYTGRLKEVREKLEDKDLPKEHQMALLLSLSLHSSGKKLVDFYRQYFKKFPSLLKPYFEFVIEHSVFTPRRGQAEVFAILQGKKNVQLKWGREGLLEYRPEFREFLYQAVPEIPNMKASEGLAFLQILEEVGDRIIVPQLVQVFTQAPDLQQYIVKVVSELQKGDRLVDILNHFKRRTKIRLVSEMVDRTLRRVKEEKY